MNASKTLLVALAAALAALVLGAVGAASYWAGSRAPVAAPEAMQAEPGAASAVASKATQPRKLLYYRNPMGLADTSPTPKKDPMGMDYVAVYAGEDDSARPIGLR